MNCKHLIGQGVDDVIACRKSRRSTLQTAYFIGFFSKVSEGELRDEYKM